MAIRKRPSISTNLNQTNRELLIHLRRRPINTTNS